MLQKRFATFQVGHFYTHDEGKMNIPTPTATTTTNRAYGFHKSIALKSYQTCNERIVVKSLSPRRSLDITQRISTTSSPVYQYVYKNIIMEPHELQPAGLGSILGFKTHGLLQLVFGLQTFHKETNQQSQAQIPFNLN